MTLPANFEGKFEILHKISEGGMGAVYKVRHLLLDEIRVIKVIRPQHEGDENLKLRFHHEARTATRLRHPNIAVMHDFSIGDGGTAYIVMEFIDGQTLYEVMEDKGPLPVDETLEIALQGLDALSYLHHEGYIHRDISPDNLMLTRKFDGSPLVKLIDLGIAKRVSGGADLTSTGMFLGKARYSSPEQLNGKEPDHRSDIYSFGVMLYQLLTGTSPIDGSDFSALVAGHLFRAPKDFDLTDPEGRVSPALRETVMETLEKDPDQRLGSAEELSRRLTEVRRSTGAAPAGSIAEQSRPLSTAGEIDPLAETVATAPDPRSRAKPVSESVRAAVETTQPLAAKRRLPAWLIGAAGLAAVLAAAGAWWGLRSDSASSPTPSTEIPPAEANYLLALEQMDAGDSSAAARLLRQARKADPIAKANPEWVTPGQRGSYLPHFALGMAYFETGNCVGAMKAWDESESQSVVRTTVKHDRLQAARKECDELYERAVQRLRTVLDTSADVSTLLQAATSDPAFDSLWRRSPDLVERVRSELDEFRQLRVKFDAAQADQRLDTIMTLETDITTVEEQLNELADLVMESAASSG